MRRGMETEPRIGRFPIVSNCWFMEQTTWQA